MNQDNQPNTISADKTERYNELFLQNNQLFLDSYAAAKAERLMLKRSMADGAVFKQTYRLASLFLILILRTILKKSSALILK